MLMHRFIWLLMALTLLFAEGCSKEEPNRIDLGKREVLRGEGQARTGTIRIAVGGMITPKEGLVYYREFLDYIGNELGKPVEYVDIPSYEETNKMLEDRDIDAAIVCSGPYVDGHSKFGLELLAAPKAFGAAVYYSYIIVPKESTAKTLDDLKGKTFAFSDPLSNSGKLVPEYLLAKKGYSSSTFFSKTVYSGSHDKSIQAVAGSLVDGAAVDSLIWEYLAKTKPELTAKTRIILKSEPYTTPPFVAHPAMDPLVKEKLRTILLTAHTTPKGREILNKMMTESYVAVQDRDYDSVRDMKKWVSGRQKER